MKVYIVECCPEYDCGHIEAVFDSRDKAQALLNHIFKEGSTQERLWDRASDRMHKLKRAMGYPDGTPVPFDHKWNKVWARLYDRFSTSPWRWSYRNFIIKEYEVQ